ncbi:RNA-directed DNA polymerase, eukaryota [Tanacetum coccineum]|uniref:RNA-directed DNA polymerase, eukaryota n=1 Tax=Tanacetum coccineum TaxID=301880 RepID=A0ABQ5DFB9_9ASTR
MYNIKDHVACGVSSIMSDANILINIPRDQAHVYCIPTAAMMAAIYEEKKTSMILVGKRGCNIIITISLGKYTTLDEDLCRQEKKTTCKSYSIKTGLITVIPIAVLDRKIAKVRNATVFYWLVEWSNGDVDDATWEIATKIQAKHPKFNQAWKEVVDKVLSRLSRWKMKLLLIGGSVTLLKSVLGGSPTGIHGLFSGWYCGLASRKVTLGVSMAWAKGVTTGTLVRYETSCGRLLGNLLEDKEVRRSG